MSDRQPNCWLADDGEHFWFDHDCSLVNDEGTNIQEWAVSEGFNHATMLPIGPEGWQIVQKDPLTVAPSILCGGCGVHGFFRDGEWVSA
jgi:hypothetical protein